MGNFYFYFKYICNKLNIYVPVSFMLITSYVAIILWFFMDLEFLILPKQISEIHDSVLNQVWTTYQYEPLTGASVHKPSQFSMSLE